MTDISAVICTRNRRNYLQRAVDSLLAQRTPGIGTEIIVVDNGSSDDTRQVLERYARHGVRYLHEPAAGLSNARNAGWRNAAGRYVAYLDDDAIADADWLALIVDRFETAAPAPGSVGGRVSAIWESPPPRWLVPQLEPWLGVIDWAPSPSQPGGDIPYLVGANIAFRRDLLERHGGFDTRLGRRGSNLMGNEEILMQRLLESDGFPPCYDPDIHVRHHVQRDRLRRRWFVRRFFWQGIGDEVYRRLFPGDDTGDSVAAHAGLAAHALLLAAARTCALRRDAAEAGFRACYHCGHVWARLRPSAAGVAKAPARQPA